MSQLTFWAHPEKMELAPLAQSDGLGLRPARQNFSINALI
jgi:hypothetical protein